MSSQEQEDKIELATKEILSILNKFSDEEINFIMQKIKLHHLELKVASFEVQRLLENTLQ